MSSSAATKSFSSSSSVESTGRTFFKYFFKGYLLPLLLLRPDTTVPGDWTLKTKLLPHLLRLLPRLQNPINSSSSVAWGMVEIASGSISTGIGSQTVG